MNGGGKVVGGDAKRAWKLALSDLHRTPQQPPALTGQEVAHLLSNAPLSH